jgi:hypothetical protein
MFLNVKYMLTKTIAALIIIPVKNAITSIKFLSKGRSWTNRAFRYGTQAEANPTGHFRIISLKNVMSTKKLC